MNHYSFLSEFCEMLDKLDAPDELKNKLRKQVFVVMVEIVARHEGLGATSEQYYFDEE
jgi:hypothetical protein